MHSLVLSIELNSEEEVADKPVVVSFNGDVFSRAEAVLTAIGMELKGFDDDESLSEDAIEMETSCLANADI